MQGGEVIVSFVRSSSVALTLGWLSHAAANSTFQRGFCARATSVTLHAVILTQNLVPQLHVTAY